MSTSPSNQSPSKVDFMYFSDTGGIAAPSDYLAKDKKQFLLWLDQAIKTFQKIDPKDLAKALDGNTMHDLFPTYRNTEETRNKMQELATQVKDKKNLTVLNPKAVNTFIPGTQEKPPQSSTLERIFDRTILGVNIDLNHDESNFIELVQHIVFSHVNQFTSLVKKPELIPFLNHMGNLGNFNLVSPSTINARQEAIKLEIEQLEQERREREVAEESEFVLQDGVEISDPNIIEIDAADIDLEKTRAENLVTTALKKDSEATLTILESHLNSKNISLLEPVINLIESPEAKIKAIKMLHKHLNDSLLETPDDFQNKVGIELAKLLKEGFNQNQKMRETGLVILNQATNYINRLKQSENPEWSAFGISLNALIDESDL